jgi:hypothetical protein
MVEKTITIGKDEYDELEKRNLDIESALNEAKEDGKVVVIRELRNCGFFADSIEVETTNEAIKTCIEKVRKECEISCPSGVPEGVRDQVIDDFLGKYSLRAVLRRRRAFLRKWK